MGDAGLQKSLSEIPQMPIGAIDKHKLVGRIGHCLEFWQLGIGVKFHNLDMNHIIELRRKGQR